MADNQPKMPDVGPIGQNLIRAVEELREERGLSYRKLSAALDDEAGRPVFPLGLSRLAKGERRVDVDELVALSVVLGVNPSALLLPRDAGGDDLVELAPKVSQRAWIAWAWADGETPLPDEDPGPLQPATLPESAVAWFRENARPEFALSGRDPLVSEVEVLLSRVKQLARARAAAGPLAANNATWLEGGVRTQIERVKLAADESFRGRPPAALLSGEGELKA